MNAGGIEIIIIQVV